MLGINKWRARSQHSSTILSPSVKVLFGPPFRLTLPALSIPAKPSQSVTSNEIRHFTHGDWRIPKFLIDYSPPPLLLAGQCDMLRRQLSADNAHILRSFSEVSRYEIDYSGNLCGLDERVLMSGNPLTEIVRRAICSVHYQLIRCQLGHLAQGGCYGGIHLPEQANIVWIICRALDDANAVCV
jgi:hypothetical protein